MNMVINIARDANDSTAQVKAFLRDLTALSHRHGIGIAGSSQLFVLERDDFVLSYECDSESRLKLA